MEKIGILGCGWLGLSLAELLVKKGFEVKGSTTKPEKLSKLRAVGISPFLIELNPEIIADNIDNFLNINILIIDIPPKLKFQDADFHLKQIKNLVCAIEKSSIEKIIFISSTSVYHERNESDISHDIFEDDLSTNESPQSHVLIKVEDLLKTLGRKLTVLRFGGLMGYDRIPVKYFAGWKGLTNGEIPVNYLHRDDAIAIIAEIIEQNCWQETLNVCSPIHPVRREIYLKNCQDLGFEMPEFIIPIEPQPYKIICIEKLMRSINYTFKFENPLDYTYDS